MTLYQDLIEFNWNLLFSILTFLVLFFVLYKFFFKKVHDFMEQRKEAVEKQLDDAQKAQDEADARLKKYENVIEKAEDEGRDILKEARKTADAQAEQIVIDARKEALGIVKQAETDAENERAKATKQMRDDIADIAIMAAREIVKKELNKDDQKEIINRVIDEAGEGKWQS